MNSPTYSLRGASVTTKCSTLSVLTFSFNDDSASKVLHFLPSINNAFVNGTALLDSLVITRFQTLNTFDFETGIPFLSLLASCISQIPVPSLAPVIARSPLSSVRATLKAALLVGRLVGWLVGWLVSWLVGQLVGWLVGQLVGPLVADCLKHTTYGDWPCSF